MSYLTANVPPIEVLVDKRFLTNGEQEGWLSGYLVSVKAIKHRALTFEVFLTPYGALYDKIPISALAWNENAAKVALKELEHWDALSWNFTVIEKSFTSQMDCRVVRQNIKAQYLFTIDPCHSDPNEVNTGLSLTASEHKSYNFVKREDGRFGLYPNNLLIFDDQSLTDPNEKPDFLRAMQNIYYSEGGRNYGTTDKFNYEND